MGGSCTIRKGLAILAQESQCSELPRSVDVRLAKIANDVQRDNGRDAPRRQVVGNSFRRVPRIIENINPIAVCAYIARKIAAVLLLLSFVQGEEVLARVLEYCHLNLCVHASPVGCLRLRLVWCDSLRWRQSQVEVAHRLGKHGSVTCCTAPSRAHHVEIHWRRVTGAVSISVNLWVARVGALPAQLPVGVALTCSVPEVSFVLAPLLLEIERHCCLLLRVDAPLAKVLRHCKTLLGRASGEETSTSSGATRLEPDML